MSERLAELVEQIDSAFPTVSSGHDDPMIDGLSALSQLEDFAGGLIEQLETADAFARVADAYCWDSKTTTHDDLMNARAKWQSEVGRAKLRAASSPAKNPLRKPGRSSECGHDGWQAGCPVCEQEERDALRAMGEPS